MRKIPCVFDRDWNKHPPAQPRMGLYTNWVLNPLYPVVATKKYDGTCVAVWDGRVYKRRTVEYDEKPTNFVLDLDLRDVPPLTEMEECYGWVPIQVGHPEDQRHVEGAKNTARRTGLKEFPNGTYELVGPGVQGNPHGFDELQLIRHGADYIKMPEITDVAHLYRWVKVMLNTYNKTEGLVFTSLEAQLQAKVTRKDFGLKWPVVR